MSKKEFSDITEGDIVRNIGSGNSYIVVHVDSHVVVAVRTITLENPDEWEYAAKSKNV